MSRSIAKDNCILEGHPIRSVVSGRACTSSNHTSGCVRIKYLCKPSYQWRWFGNKGIAIVLLWSFGAFSAFNYLFKLRVSNPTNSNRYKYLLAISISSFLFPVVGWLADVRIGRYRVIKSSMLLMWMGAILLCLAYIVNLYLDNSRTVFIALASSSSFVMASGVGCFLVSITQFSIDQLRDSSSVQIISFITWYMWTYFTSKAVSEFMVCLRDHQKEIFPLLVLCAVLTASVASDFLFGHWLVKEPVTHNPLKLIFQVLRYAAKNKYPSDRSAYTYWDDERYSRIDWAKAKYGGPFTTKQVEDVRAFFRIFGLISLGCFFFAISLYTGSDLHASVSNFRCFYSTVCNEGQGMKCLKRVAISNMGYLLLSLCIPLYEFVILPVFRKCLPQLRAFLRMMLGGVLGLLHLLGLLSLEVVGKLVTSGNNTTDATTCSHLQSQAPEDSTYYWLALLSFGYAVGQCYFITAAMEFIWSQTPYGMKGLMFGCVFTVLGVGMTLVYVLFLPFQYTVISVSGTIMGCVFWFLLSCSLLATLVIIGFSAASYCYKNRRRDDDSESETNT